MEELKEFKQLYLGSDTYGIAKSNYDLGCEVGYNKAIDVLIVKYENAKFIESEIVLSDIHQGTNSGLSMAIHFAEQLKAGESE